MSQSKKVSRTESVYSYPKPGNYPVSKPGIPLSPEQERRRLKRLQRVREIEVKGNWERPEATVANKLSRKLMGW
jgi:hypothetical protein